MGKTRTFEEELKQLEAEVSLMEEGNLPLDELIAHFRQGTEAAKTVTICFRKQKMILPF